MKNVLDHGFVRLVDHMGDDAAIVQAARTSYGEGTKTPSDDRSLIRYLMRHWHTTPFEMVEFKFHMRLPVFVARQMIRHRSASVNEYSARYSVVPELYYSPDPSRIGRQSETNKQGTGEPLSADDAGFISELIDQKSDDLFKAYNGIVLPKSEGGQYGVARELARIVLPANMYTEWYYKMDLHNLFHLLRLRTDDHAQWEIQEYGRAMLALIEPIVPIACEAWVDYRRDAVSLSRMELEVLRKMIAAGGFVQTAGPEMSKREWMEFLDKIGQTG